jgi:serine/threonine-protein kinase PknG
VWTTDPSCVSAAYGLARARLAEGDRAGAVEALTSVPESSSHHADAQAAAIVAALSGRDPSTLGRSELVEIAGRLERLGLTGVRRQRLTVLILRAALDRIGVRALSGGSAGTEILGVRLTERGLRFGLERGYRDLARMSRKRRERIALVELANAARPTTLF